MSEEKVIPAKGVGRAEIFMITSEVICILFYGLFVEFGSGSSTKTTEAGECPNC